MQKTKWGSRGIEPAPFRLYVYLKFVCTFTVAPACLLQSGRSRFATVRVKNWEFEIKPACPLVRFEHKWQGNGPKNALD